MIKVTDFNELENLAEFQIFIWGTASSGDLDIWATKLYSVRMQIQNGKSFSDSNDESRFGQMTIFRKNHSNK
jgi:hypothetical protein